MKLIHDLDLYSFRLGLPKWCCVFMPLIYVTTWPVIVYRYQHWVWKNVNIPILGQILTLIGYLLKVFVLITTSVTISHKAYIGKGLFISHIGSIVIGNESVIGDYCSLHQGVTLGGAGIGDDYGKPKIGDNVFIGVGAVIMGKVTLGDNVAIGANAVVTKSFADNVSIGGVPAKVLNEKGSLGMIHYRNSI